jgi:hypothetical protein
VSSEYAILDESGVERCTTQTEVFFALLRRGMGPVQAVAAIGQRQRMDQHGGETNA